MTQQQIRSVLIGSNYKPTAENIAELLGGFVLADVSDLEIRTNDNGKKYAVIWTHEGEHRNHGARVEIKNLKPATTREALAEGIKIRPDLAVPYLDINNYKLKKMTNNKPQTLAEFTEQQEDNGFAVFYVGKIGKENAQRWGVRWLCVGSLYTFYVDKYARTRSCNYTNYRNINYVYRVADANNARTHSAEVWAIITPAAYFEKLEQRKAKRGEIEAEILNNQRRNHDGGKLRISCNYKTWTDEMRTYFVGGYYVGELPRAADDAEIYRLAFDKSGYFLPKVRQELKRRAADMIRQNKAKRWTELDKSPLLAQIAEPLGVVNSLLNEKATPAEIMKPYGVKTCEKLKDILQDAAALTKWEKYTDAEDWKRHADEWAEDAAFWLDVIRLGLLGSIGCRHQYQRTASGWEMTPKYKADHYWSSHYLQEFQSVKQ